MKHFMYGRKQETANSFKVNSWITQKIDMTVTTVTTGVGDHAKPVIYILQVQQLALGEKLRSIGIHWSCTSHLKKKVNRWNFF